VFFIMRRNLVNIDAPSLIACAESAGSPGAQAAVPVSPKASAALDSAASRSRHGRASVAEAAASIEHLGGNGADCGAARPLGISQKGAAIDVSNVNGGRTIHDVWVTGLNGQMTERQLPTRVLCNLESANRESTGFSECSLVHGIVNVTVRPGGAPFRDWCDGGPDRRVTKTALGTFIERAAPPSSGR